MRREPAAFSVVFDATTKSPLYVEFEFEGGTHKRAGERVLRPDGTVALRFTEAMMRQVLED